MKKNNEPQDTKDAKILFFTWSGTSLRSSSFASASTDQVNHHALTGNRYFSYITFLNNILKV